MKIECRNCNKLFERARNEIKTFCSQECRKEHAQKRYEKMNDDSFRLTEYRRASYGKQCAVCNLDISRLYSFHEFVGKAQAIMCSDDCWVIFGLNPHQYLK